MGKYEIGTIHQTVQGGPLEIVGYVDRNHRRIRFIESGYETVAYLSAIDAGKVKNPFVPSVAGVGYLGNHDRFIGHPLRKLIYDRWHDMIGRCCRHGYKPIDPSWHCFATFMQDALGLKGVELLYGHSKDNRIDLDSDIIPHEMGMSPIYSKETCQWVPCAENLRHRTPRSDFTIYPIGTRFQINGGFVILKEKDYNRWLIEFEDGNQRWVSRGSVTRGVLKTE